MNEGKVSKKAQERANVLYMLSELLVKYQRLDGKFLAVDSVDKDTMLLALPGVHITSPHLSQGFRDVVAEANKCSGIPEVGDDTTTS